MNAVTSELAPPSCSIGIGDGTPLILICGASSDRSAQAPMAVLSANRFRRSCGPALIVDHSRPSVPADYKHRLTTCSPPTDESTLASTLSSSRAEPRTHRNGEASPKSPGRHGR